MGNLNTDILPPVSDAQILNRFGKSLSIIKEMAKGNDIADGIRNAAAADASEVSKENPVTEQYAQTDARINEYGEREIPTMQEMAQTLISKYEQQRSASKLPESVLKSFDETPEMAMDFRLNANSAGVGEHKTRQNLVTEQTVPYRPSGIDYELIKNIIETVVARELDKRIGSAGEVGLIKLGKQFNFVTKDGNVYEATLKYKKNINDKKQ